MVAKVPQVQGKRLESMALLMEAEPSRGVWGKERFWIALNLRGSALGTMENGDVWKGPMREMTSEQERGPR